MFIDASAIVAILSWEDGVDALNTQLSVADQRFTSAIAIFESTMALMRKFKYDLPRAEAMLMRFLEEANIQITPIQEAESHAALMAHHRYGKGRHPAALNMGDCFAYACAKTRGVPLLYKGDDFAHTDLA